MSSRSSLRPLLQAAKRASVQRTPSLSEMRSRFLPALAFLCSSSSASPSITACGLTCCLSTNAKGGTQSSWTTGRSCRSRSSAWFGPTQSPTQAQARRRSRQPEPKKRRAHRSLSLAAAAYTEVTQAKACTNRYGRRYPRGVPPRRCAHRRPRRRHFPISATPSHRSRVNTA